MAIRKRLQRHGCLALVAAVLAGSLTWAQAAAVPPVLQGAISRKPHGAAGNFDLPLSLVASGALPPDPSTVAPPIDPTIAPNLFDTTKFLYTGPSPIQTGVAPGTIDKLRAAVVRGRVLDRAGAAVTGVQMRVLGHPEYGQTLTRLDGRFDMAVNGGGLLTLNYTKSGYLPIQRQATVPWQDYRVFDDVVMIPLDAAVTAINLAAATPIQVARGSPVTDSSGTRRATMFFAQGTTATIGGVPATSLSIRATEYTVGPTGPKAMPGMLPPTSGYTYAVELSADEAQGQQVQFSKPVVSYVENFLNFPVGGLVPAGYYDPARAAWVASNNGRVIKILTITAGMADLDTDGDGLADSPAALATLGVTDAERQTLATLYAVGQSLWRVPITHYSGWDFNWPWGPPPGATGPGGPPHGPLPGPNKPGAPPDKDCLGSGSIIKCQSQALGEALPIVGTPYQLHYSSDRMPGTQAAYQLNIPLSAATLPASLSRIELEILVAGRRTALQFPPTTGLTYAFVWDGKDAYGRTVPGVVTATVRIGYTYAVVRYQDPAQFAQNFGAISGIPMTNNSSRTEFTLWRDTTSMIMVGSVPPSSTVGGWSLSPHHAYDPAGRMLYLGDGTRRSTEALSRVIKTAAGTGDYGFSGDGGPAGLAQVSAPSSVAVAPDGSVYFADSGNNRIRRIAPNGVITTVAGTGTSGFSGDGGLAVNSFLREPNGIAIGTDGTLYIADTHNYRIRRVGTDGIITTVAGNGVADSTGDGGPATLAAIDYNETIAVAADGSFYFTDAFNKHSVRRVGPDGIITTLAGTGIAGFSGDGGPASQARLNSPRDVAVGPDGSLYVADAYNYRVRRIGTDGIIVTVAGSGTGLGPLGDGGPATLAVINPFRVALADDGGIYIGDAYNPRLRYVGVGGIITTVGGNGVYGYSGDGGLVTQAAFSSPAVVAVAPDGSLYLTDKLFHRVRRIAPVPPGLSVQDSAFASEDGSEIYVLSGGGRHLRTQETLTGSIRYQFGYDGTGQLISITDGSGNVTTIARDGSGNPTSIVAPGGQQTTLTVDANGYLATVANPANEVVQLSSSTLGLLLSLTDPKGGVYSFTYDALGRLIKDQDPAGGVKTLARVEDPTGHTVTLTTALGRVSTYQVERLATGAIRRTNSDASGARTVVLTNTDGTQTITQPDGLVITSTLGPDPRFGMASPLVVKRVRTLPGGIVETTTAARSATLSNPDDPLSLVTLNDTTTINGRTFTRNYVAATRTLTSTSAQGRQSVTVLDAKGRAVQETPAPGITPFTVTYDAQGRVTENRQGAQFRTFGYDARNRVITNTDAAGRQTVMAYDNADRIIQKTLPGGAVYQFVYDANGNRTQVILPSGSAHLLGYSPVDLDASYTPPGNGSYLRAHDVDRALTSMTLPGGRIASVGHDPAGRVSGISYLEGATTADYFALDATDRAAHVNHAPTAGPAQNLAFTYNGRLITGMTATGASPAQVTYAFGNDFALTNMNLTSGGDTVTAALTRDQDGILAGFGPFALTRAGPGGALSAISDGTPNTSTTYGYDALGRKATRSHQVNGQATYALQVTFDLTGRLTAKSETIGGTVYTQAYTYDSDGQLTNVTRNGVAAEHYTYDVNGNRASRQLNAGPIETALYDTQDRLTLRGTVAYVFNSDGYLAQRGADTFSYNTRGQLIQATVAAQPITYAYDGLGRRVSRTDVGGTTRYLYGDPSSHLVTAVRDTAGALTKLYYDTAGMLIALERGGARYHVAVDQVGTPRVVSNSAGVVIKTADADSFGNSIADTNPGFDLPIGYAGGLVDPGTGLIHFGLRDYDTASGRWTARDPVLFTGGQANLYVYVGNSPLGNRDPLGLFCVSVSVYEGLGGGVQSCFSTEGASVCGEAGAGLGSSVTLDNAGLEKDGIQLVGEITAASPFVKYGLDGSLDALTGCAKVTPKLQVVQGTYDTKGKNGLELLPTSPGIEGKFGVKVCVAQKF